MHKLLDELERTVDNANDALPESLNPRDQVKYKKKSVTISFLLSLFFGGFGLFYTSWVLALSVLALTVGIIIIMSGLLPTSMIGFISWMITLPLSILSAMWVNSTLKEEALKEYDATIKAESDRQELLQAVREGANK